MIAAMMYTNNPLPAPTKEANTQIKRTKVGSILKYFPIPPHTPHTILLSTDLNNFFCSMILSPFAIFILAFDLKNVNEEEK